MKISQAPLDVVPIESPTGVTREVRATLLNDYFTYGFGLFQIVSVPDDPSQLLADLADALGLGPPFIPALYASSNVGLYNSFGINAVIAGPRPQSPMAHPAFGSRSALELHTDGTLQPIGHVRTVLLFCVRPAWQGGDSTIFRAVSEFSILEKTQRNLSAALLDSRALTRRATVNGSRASCVGPVYAFEGKDVLTRFSLTNSDEWAVDEVPYLREAKQSLMVAAQFGSPNYVQIRLQRGQGLLIANDKVAHGRTEFEDGGGWFRHMLRGLYRFRPQL